MASSLIPKFHTLFSITSASDTFTIQEVTKAAHAGNHITQGDYFIQEYSGEGANGLVEHMQAAVRALGPVGDLDDFTVTLSATGFITLSNTGNFDITWTDAELQNILGFTGNLTGASTYTATNQPKYCWYPNVGPVSLLSHTHEDGVISSDAMVTRAPSGRVTHTRYHTFTDQELRFRFLESQYVFPIGLGGTTILNRDYETWWTNTGGARFRYYPDRTLTTSLSGGAPHEYVMGPLMAREGSSGCAVEQATWDELWQLRMDLHKYVA